MDDTFLWEACYKGHGNIGLIQGLIDQGANIEHGGGFRGRTPFIAVCIGGYLEIAKLLVSKGCDYLVKDECGHTALHAASAGGHLDTVKYLHSLGCPIDAVENEFCFADDLLGEIGKFCFPAINVATPVMRACHNHHLDVVKFLHSVGCDLTWENDLQETCLHWAFRGCLYEAFHREFPAHRKFHWTSNFELCKYVTQYGDINKPNGKGYSPAHLHVLTSPSAFTDIEWLFDNGACLDQRHSQLSAIDLCRYEDYILGDDYTFQRDNLHAAVKNNFYSRLPSEVQLKVYQYLFLFTLIEDEEEGCEKAKLFAVDKPGSELYSMVRNLSDVEVNHIPSDILDQSILGDIKRKSRDIKILDKIERTFKDGNVLTWLTDLECNPFSLKHLCRLTLRKYLQTPLRVQLSEITLPSQLKEFVMYRAGGLI